MCTCVGFKSMSMRVYMCANDLCVCVRHPACVRVPVYVFINVCVCVCVCMYDCLNRCVYVWVSVGVFICSCAI